MPGHLREWLLFGALGGKRRSKIALLALATLALGPSVWAQHVELGAFGSYTQPGIPTYAKNAFGAGVRANFNLLRILQIEVETSYDIRHSTFALSRESSSVTFVESKLGIIHANAGLKLQSRGGSYFVFLKGGANWYNPERTTTVVTGPTITATTTPGVVNSFSKGILYPGAGIGFHAGPLGIRLDVGDEIFWSNGAHNNLRVTFGPTIRF